MKLLLGSSDDDDDDGVLATLDNVVVVEGTKRHDVGINLCNRKASMGYCFFSFQTSCFDLCRLYKSSSPRSTIELNREWYGLGLWCSWNQPYYERSGLGFGIFFFLLN